jgi:hypothetical protein
MMYLPEINNSNGQQDRRGLEQQEEMYEDIVANTNPHTVLRNYDLDVMHSNVVFD